MRSLKLHKQHDFLQLFPKRLQSASSSIFSGCKVQTALGAPLAHDCSRNSCKLHNNKASTCISHVQVYLAGSSAAHQQIIDRGAWPAQSPKLDLLCVSHGSALSVCTWGLFPVAGLDIMPVAGVAAGKQATVTILKVRPACSRVVPACLML